MKYSHEDFVNGTPPRIMGSESEFTSAFEMTYAFWNNNTGYDAAIPEDATLVSCSRSDNGAWLRNGGRFYFDMEDFEFSTPECLSPSDVLAYERAGERIVSMVVAELPVDLPYRTVYKRSGYSDVRVDGEQVFTKVQVGHHENYFSMLDHEQHDLLTSYLATRPIWSGSGMIEREGYSISQQVRALERRSKGFGCQQENGRLEIKCGEGNMSDWAITSKYGMTSLVLRMIEHGEFPRELDVIDPLISYGWTAREPFRPYIDLESGKWMSPSQHQAAIARSGLQFAATHPNVPIEEVRAAQTVLESCEMLADCRTYEDAAEAVGDKIDWAAKLAYMFSEEITGRDIRGFNKPYQLIMHDLQWEDLSADGVARNWYKESGNTQIGEEKILQAMVTPPDTRAKMRVKLASQLLKISTSNIYMDWAIIGTADQALNLPDPYQA